MPVPSDYDENKLLPSLGMYALPYANVWPDLAKQLQYLYEARVQDVPFLPPGWLDQVEALHGKNGYILVPAPSSTTMGGNRLAINFLYDPGQREWWDAFNKAANDIITAYAAKQQAQGAAQLQQLYDNADFWSKAYDLATVAATPVTVARAAATQVAAVGNTIAKSPALTGLFIAGIAALGLFLLFRKR